MQRGVIEWLKILHWSGLAMLLSAIGSYSLTEMTQHISGMLLVSCLAGLGLVMMSPFPIALFLQWAQAQGKQQEKN